MNKLNALLNHLYEKNPNQALIVLRYLAKEGLLNPEYQGSFETEAGNKLLSLKEEEINAISNPTEYMELLGGFYMLDESITRNLPKESLKFLDSLAMENHVLKDGESVLDPINVISEHPLTDQVYKESVKIIRMKEITHSHDYLPKESEIRSISDTRSMALSGMLMDSYVGKLPLNDLDSFSSHALHMDLPSILGKIRDELGISKDSSCFGWISENILDEKLGHEDKMNNLSRLGKMFPKEGMDVIMKLRYDTEVRLLNHYSHMNTLDNLNRFFSDMDDAGLDVDSYAPKKEDFSRMSPFDPDFVHETHPFHEELTVLSMENPEAREILMEADDILISENAESTKAYSNAAENTGNAIALYENDVTLKVTEGTYYENAFRSKKNRFDINKDELDNAARCGGEILDKNPEPSLKKDHINEIIQIMLDNQIFDEKTFVGEQGEKIYGLQKLMNMQAALKDAVKGRNIEKISEAVRNYRETEKLYDDLLTKIEEYFPDQYAFCGNISSSRCDNVPFKYRKNYSAVSKLSGLYLALGSALKSGIDFKELVDSPSSGYAHMMRKGFEEGPLNQYFQNHTGAFLAEKFTLGDEDAMDLQKAISSYSSLKMSGSRGVSAIASLLGGEEQKDYMITEKIFSANETIPTDITGFYISTDENKINLYMKFNPNLKKRPASSTDFEFFMGLLCAKKEDRSPYLLSSQAKDNININTMERGKNFDVSLAIERNGNISEILTNMINYKERMEAVNDQNEFIHPKAAKREKFIVGELSNLLSVNKRIEKDSFDEHILSSLKKDDLNSITPSDRRTIDAKTKVFGIRKENITLSDVKAEIGALASMQEEYNERPFYMKWFGSQTRRLDKALSSMKDVFIKKGMDKDYLSKTITDINKGRLNLDDIPDPVENHEDLRVPFAIEEANEEKDDILIDAEKKENVLDDEIHFTNEK